MSGVRLREATAADAEAIAVIYNHYISNTTVTFEEETVTPEIIQQRLAKVRGEGLPWLVAVDADVLADIPHSVSQDERARAEADALLGYAYAGPFQDRSAYRHSVEASAYLRDGERGRGVGTKLYGAVLEIIRELKPSDSPHAPVHRVYARVALPNEASVAMQQRFGFREAGTLSQAGFKLGRWIDIGFWELRLDELP